MDKLNEKLAQYKQALKQTEANWNAINGAIQVLEELISEKENEDVGKTDNG